MFPFVAILTTEGILQECNHASVPGGGITSQDLGKPLWEARGWAAHADAREKLRDAVSRAAGGESVQYQGEIPLTDSAPTAIIIRLLPLRDEQSRVAHIVFEGREINQATETSAAPSREVNEANRQPRDANAQLQAIWANSLFAARMDPAVGASALLAAIVDSSDDAIISKDLNGIIMSWNKSAERLFGYTAAEAVGQSILMLIPPERVYEEPEILDRLKRGERVDHFETVRLRKDGSRLNISLTISPVKDAQGRIFGASKNCARYY